jgi:hypothetical protein
VGELTLFGNWFDDYILDELTGEQQDGLQVVRFVQKDARFVGAEFSATWTCWRACATTWISRSAATSCAPD